MAKFPFGSSLTAAADLRHELSLKRLADTFETSLARSSVSGRDGMTPTNFYANIRDHSQVVRRKVANETYRFRAYKEHLILKGAGKAPRVLSIPTVRDRLVLKLLSKIVARQFPSARTPLAPAMIAELTRVLESSNLDSFIRIDVEDFYPSIRHDLVMKNIKRRIKSKKILSLVLSAIRAPTYPVGPVPLQYCNVRGVPQGLAVSNVLAELSMTDFDSTFAGRRDVRYFRYVDDVLILCSADAQTSLQKEAVELLSTMGLSAHPFTPGSKSAIGRTADKFDFLGYVFEWPRIGVRSTSIAKLEDSIVKVFTAYRKYVEKNRSAAQALRALKRCELRVNLKITGCVFENSRRGWISYYSQIRNQKLLKHLDSYTAMQMRRFGLESAFELKSFTKAQRYAAKGALDISGFVPNFDDMSADETRKVLDEYFLMEPRLLAQMPDNDVMDVFKRKMHKLVVELERDVQARY